MHLPDGLKNVNLTENPSKQTPKGSRRMYQPAQKPAMGQPTKMSPRNQMKDQKGLPPPDPRPPPAAILRAVRKLEICRFDENCFPSAGSVCRWCKSF